MIKVFQNINFIVYHSSSKCLGTKLTLKASESCGFLVLSALSMPCLASLQCSCMALNYHKHTEAKRIKCYLSPQLADHWKSAHILWSTLSNKRNLSSMIFQWSRFKHFTNLFCCAGKIIVTRVGKLKVGQGSFPRDFRRFFHLKLKWPN